MNTIDYIQRQFDAMRRQIINTLTGLTDEQINWAPPGKANKISAIFLHAASGEDRFVQTLAQGKPTLWESQDWAARIGVPITPSGRGGWDETSQATLQIAHLMAYQEAVALATNTYLATLGPDDLDRKVEMFNGERPLADLLVMLVSHVTGHIGEIAALKGVQGI